MMKIRLSDENDAEKVGHVLHNCYNIDTLDEGKSAYLGELSKKHSFVIAEVDDKIVGLASFKLHGLPKHGLAELDRIAVLEDYRRQGVASKLFQGLVDELKKHYEKHGMNLRKLFLLTHEDNTRAQYFYKCLGFSNETVLKDHYYKDVSELVMSMFF